MEHPRSERWSFPCLFCGTQVTRVRIPILTEGVRSTPGVRGGASPAYSAVPKSQELSAPFELLTVRISSNSGEGGRVSKFTTRNLPKVSMKRAILRAFHLFVRTKVQKSVPLMELFSGTKMNSLENLAMHITNYCTIQKARRTSPYIVLSFVLFQER